MSNILRALLILIALYGLYWSICVARFERRKQRERPRLRGLRTGGPSYIEVGAAIGDQGAAFQLFALGAALGLWTVITPRTLGFDDEALIRQMAGNGFVMISGYRSASSAVAS